MPIEIEAKMRLGDLAALEARLEEEGATRLAVIFETNTFFDTRDGAFKSSDQGLRIRIERGEGGDERVVLTHKGPRAHGRLKSRNETEVVVDSGRSAAELLGALGYLPVLTFEKRRTRYELGGCRVELDELPYLGAFCEIEGPNDETVLAVREKLGLAEAPLVHASYIAMLVSYAREHHLKAKLIRFEPATA